MSAKPRGPVDRRQGRASGIAWADPAEILRAWEGRGPVVYEAPEAARLARARPRSRPAPLRVTCWSCSKELGEQDVVRGGPGLAACPSCGARLPFAE